MKSRPKLEEWLGVACMVALTLITLGNVLTRYLTDQSFAWTEEISVFLIVVMTLAGAAGVARRDGHIRIEYFYEGGSAARRRRLRLSLRPRRRWLSWLWPCSSAPPSPTRSAGARPRWGWACRAGGSRVAIPPLCLAIAARAAQAGWHAWRGDPESADPADHEAPL